MDDLISRQAALDAFKVRATIGRGNGKSVAFKIANDYADIVRKRIEALPSAQPEIIRCEDCKYGHKLTTADNIRVLLCNYKNAHGMFVENDGFCKWAERRTDETD